MSLGHAFYMNMQKQSIQSKFLISKKLLPFTLPLFLVYVMVNPSLTTFSKLVKSE